MSLTPDTRLGPYQVIAQIGAGGMGEVYRAVDTNLKRQVALKVLPDGVATDPDRLARFQREAELLAALNHPNIAQIHGIERSGHATALVMELVEGPTLADLIATGLRIDDALRIARQIAEALESAHEQGIVHRDLKPANIKVRHDGTVKVLDFGLAKALEPLGARAAANTSISPTIASPARTEIGVILGTAAYMAPEQARGRTIDKRADVWAFGCVLFEMLTGKRAFAGDDVSEVLASVLAREPDWTAWPAAAPTGLEAYVRRCLQRDPKQRIHDIADVRLALEGAFDTPVPSVVERVQGRPWQRPFPLALMALLLMALSVVATWALRPRPRTGLVTRFSFDLPADQTFRRVSNGVAAFSRDGRVAVYNTDSGIYLRPMDAEQVQLIAGTTQNDLGCVALSPDGQWVAFYDFERRELRRTSVAGGASSLIVERSQPPAGLSWEADDTLLFGGPEGILRTAATGGTPTVVVAAEVGERLREPSLLPDGRSVLFTATKGTWSEAQIVVAELAGGDRTVVVPRGAAARYVRSGHLVYTVGQSLYGQVFDVNRHTTSGAAVSLIQAIYRENALATTFDYGLSDDGTLMYVSGGGQRRSFVWVDRQGKVLSSFESASQLQQPRISPDGSQVAYSATGDIWTWTFSTGTRSGLTNDNDSQWNVIWDPDPRNSRILFDSGAGDVDRQILRRAADGSGSAEVFTTPPGGFPNSVSPDGKFLIFHTNPRVAMVQPLDRTVSPRPLVSSEKGQSSDGEFSPDGRWVAYESNASGSFQVLVRPFPEVEARRIQISPAGGQHPAWSRDGKELFFLAGDGQLMATRVTLGDNFSHEQPVPLFPAGQYYVNVARDYDVAPDGKRFLFVRIADQVSVKFHVVRNWVEELKRLVPTN